MEVEKQCKSYIDQLAQSDKLPPLGPQQRLTIHDLVGHENLGLASKGDVTATEAITRLLEYFNECSRKQGSSLAIEIAEALIATLPNDPSDFLAIIQSDAATRHPILSLTNPNEFAENLQSVRGGSWSAISTAIRLRLSNHGPQFAEERNWPLGFDAALTGRAEELRKSSETCHRLQAYRLSRLLIELES